MKIRLFVAAALLAGFLFIAGCQCPCTGSTCPMPQKAEATQTTADLTL